MGPMSTIIMENVVQMMNDKLNVGYKLRPRSRFRRALINLIKKNKSKFDDFTISPKIRQILQHWGYILTEKTINNNITPKIFYKICKMLIYYYFINIYCMSRLPFINTNS